MTNSETAVNRSPRSPPLRVIHYHTMNSDYYNEPPQSHHQHHKPAEIPGGEGSLNKADFLSDEDFAKLVSSGKLGGGGVVGPDDYNPDEMMTGHARPHHSKGGGGGGGGGGIIGPEDYGEYDPQAVPHPTSTNAPHQRPHHAPPSGGYGDTYAPPPYPPGWAMPEGQTVGAYSGASYQAPQYNPSQSHAYSHIPDMASPHDEDTDPELFHQAAQRLHYSQQQQLHRPQQDYSSQPPRPTPFDGYSNESPQPSHVNAPAGGYDANQYRPQQEYGSQPPYNAPPSVPSHNEEYRPPRPAHSNAPAGGYSQFDSAPLDTDDDKPLAQAAQQHQPQRHTGGHNAPAGGLSVGGGGDDKYSSHLAAHEQAYGGSHDGPMDSDSIGSAAAIQAIKMNAQQNESVQHPPAGASPKPPSAPSGNTPPAPSQEEEETDSATAAAPPSTGNPAQDKIIALAMAQASKLFDKKNGTTGGPAQNEAKIQAMHSAASTAMRLFGDYRTTGKLSPKPGDMQQLMGAAMSFLK